MRTLADLLTSDPANELATEHDLATEREAARCNARERRNQKRQFDSRNVASAKSFTRQRVIRPRIVRPRSSGSSLTEEVEVLFHDVQYSGEITSQIQDNWWYEIPSTLESEYVASTQLFYYLLSYFPTRAITHLIGADILANTRSADDLICQNSWGEDIPRPRFKVEATDSFGYHPVGMFTLNSQSLEKLHGDGTTDLFPAKLSEQLYHDCVDTDHRHALEIMEQLGFFTKQRPSDSIGDGPIAQAFGVSDEELGPAHYALFYRRKDNTEGYVHPLRKKDMRSANNVRIRKLNRGWRNWRSIVNNSRRQGKRPWRKSKRAQSLRQLDAMGQNNQHRGNVAASIPLSHRTIDSAGALYRACAYIVESHANADHFTTGSAMLREPVARVLRFVNSRRDLRKSVELGKIAKRTYSSLDNTLRRWEQNAGYSILNFPAMFDGQFLDHNGNEVLVGMGSRTFHIGRDYESDPSRFVTSDRELRSAVRRVLGGVCSIDYFKHLDPRARMILTYATEMHELSCATEILELSNGLRSYNVEVIAQVRVPELRHRLIKAQLLDVQYEFVLHTNRSRSSSLSPVRTLDLSGANGFHAPAKASPTRLQRVEQDAPGIVQNQPGFNYVPTPYLHSRR